MDEIGLDVVCNIEQHYASESGDPADLPPPILTERVARGDLVARRDAAFTPIQIRPIMAPDFLDPERK